LRALGLTLASLALLLLLGEAFFMFRPITRRSSSDMFNLAILVEQLGELFPKDGLTGIYNRRNQDEQLAQEWRRAASEDQELAILFIDGNYFKAFNDTYGHQAGDHALKRVSDAAGRALKCAGDFLARYGGEEFAVVLPQIGINSALRLAENIRVASRLWLCPMPAPRPATCHLLTVRPGVAVARQERLDSMIEAADQTLCRAKQADQPGSQEEDWL
jgi:diguanylate cyclase (GGDEF)-like protein